jgi:hypothetical protein
VQGEKTSVSAPSEPVAWVMAHLSHPSWPTLSWTQLALAPQLRVGQLGRQLGWAVELASGSPNIQSAQLQAGVSPAGLRGAQLSWGAELFAQLGPA